MDYAARLRRAPAAARRPPSRPAPGTAVSGPGAVLALQRAVGNQAVAALLGQPALQRADDVFDSKHFTDPVAYLHSRPGQPAVVEDPGSAGITGRPDRALITELADPATRAQYRGGLIGQRDQAALDKQNYDQQSLTATDAQRPQILVQAREAGDRHAGLEKLCRGLNGVNNRRSAALFFQQNSMTLAALGLSPTVSHHAGGAVAATYLFHRDAGLLTIAPPNALANGPWQRGWVQGHEIVTNWKHRFIEHVHVNKKQPDGFEIYNGTKDDATKVETWIKGAGKKLATPAKSEEIAIATALTKAAADQRARDLETVAQ